MTDIEDKADKGALSTIGARLAAHRIARNLSQRALAEEAGVALRTVQRLEAGEAATQLAGFLRVCRVLGLLDRIDALIPEPPPSPIAQLRRHRARPKRAGKTAARKGPWKWGEGA
ncbi:MAG TPA: helix-turn-helix domain-containing protein [Gemmatimonadaceae bacterium]|nr:helix-turn-helix domain-containing protein [Gemmatimonadaceae bacterium]